MDSLCKSYADLKEIIINSSNENGTFASDQLKDVFSSQINSLRAYSQINDLVSLIDILEKRDVLSPENVDLLEHMFYALNLSFETLNTHKSLIDQSKNTMENNHTEQRQYRKFDYRREVFPPSTSQTKTFANRQRSHMKLSDEVVSAVASQIGYSWKALARYLDVMEGTLENIEEDKSISTNEMRARLMLAEYERTANPPELCSRLLNALELSKRRDLHEQVVKILLREASF